MPEDWNIYRTRFLVRAKQLSQSIAFTDPLGLHVCGDSTDPSCGGDCDPYTGICGGCPLGGSFCPVPAPGGGDGGGEEPDGPRPPPAPPAPKP